jgi:hypothetical protein
MLKDVSTPYTPDFSCRIHAMNTVEQAKIKLRMEKEQEARAVKTEEGKGKKGVFLRLTSGFTSADFPVATIQLKLRQP